MTGPSIRFTSACVPTPVAVVRIWGLTAVLGIEVSELCCRLHYPVLQGWLQMEECDQGFHTGVPIVVTAVASSPKLHNLEP